MDQIPGLNTITEKERLAMKQPINRMIVQQSDGVAGLYVHFLGEWLLLKDVDLWHLDNHMRNGKSMTATFDAVSNIQSQLEIIRLRAGITEKIAVARNHKFEIVITVCLTVMKAVGAIDLKWLWVFSPIIGSIVFTASIGIINRVINGPILPGQNGSGNPV